MEDWQKKAIDIFRECELELQFPGDMEYRQFLRGQRRAALNILAVAGIDPEAELAKMEDGK